MNNEKQQEISKEQQPDTNSIGTNIDGTSITEETVVSNLSQQRLLTKSI